MLRKTIVKKTFFYLIFVASLLVTSNLFAGQKLSLMLDWFPNVDHLPIYVADEMGYFSDNKIDVKIISPSETSDALKLAASGNVDIAVSYQPQTIIAVDKGLNIKAIAPLVAHPLTTLLFLDSKGINSPQDLSGKKIGYTVPGLMDVLLQAFATINKIEDYTPVNVGFTILPALSSNKVDAVMGPFKTYETVGMAQHGYTADFFELEKYGIPDYEELIFVCSEKSLKNNKKAIHGFVKAVAKGLKYTKAHPQKALALYLSAVPQADKKIETEAFKLTLPYFAEHDHLHDISKWQKFADFALKYKLINKKMDVTKIIHNW
jgi:putative hydroxymethylpyrimidine transport system substrate-binding protein